MGFSKAADSHGGVGGFEGMKKAGKHAAQDCDINQFGELVQFMSVSTYNYGCVQHDVWHSVRSSCPQRTDELTKSTSQWVCQGCNSGGRDTSLVGKPQVAVSRRRSEDERLRESDDDLTEHDHAEVAIAARSGPSITNPVSDQ